VLLPCRCLRTLTVRGLATIVTVAAGDRASHGLLSTVLQHGMAEALLSALEAPQHRRGSLIVVRSWAVHSVPLGEGLAFGATCAKCKGTPGTLSSPVHGGGTGDNWLHIVLN